MAKRKTATQSRTQIVRVPSAPQVITVASSPRRRSSGGGKRRRKSSGRRKGPPSNQLNASTLTSAGIGGFAFGLIVKNFPQLPTIPIVGKAGTVALLAMFLKGKLPYAKEVGIAAASIAGYQMGTEGHILGDHDFAQVRGVAAQV